MIEIFVWNSLILIICFNWKNSQWPQFSKSFVLSLQNRPFYWIHQWPMDCIHTKTRMEYENQKSMSTLTKKTRWHMKWKTKKNIAVPLKMILLIAIAFICLYLCVTILFLSHFDHLLPYNSVSVCVFVCVGVCMFVVSHPAFLLRK